MQITVVPPFVFPVTVDFIGNSPQEVVANNSDYVILTLLNSTIHCYVVMVLIAIILLSLAPAS